MKLSMLAVFTVCLSSSWSLVRAADHEVKMLNRGGNGTSMVFEPLLVHAQPGDTITFIPTDKSHNSTSMDNGIPEGATAWNGKLNTELKVTVYEEGIYMYKCNPHFGMGMIGAIVVGTTANLDTVKNLRYPGKAKAVAEEIFTQIEEGRNK